MNRFHAVGASVAVAVWALSFPAPVSASISDLDVSFCDSGISSKRLQLEIETLPWERVACVRYVNLGTETIDVALSATDGFVLADGKIGCADDSADTGAFSTLIRYEWGDSTFSLSPKQSVDRTVRFLVPSVESATAYGCLITGPKPATGSGSEGISVVVRRANIVELTFTWAATPSPISEISEIREEVVDTASSQSLPQAETKSRSLEPKEFKENAPVELFFLASIRDISSPFWAVALVIVLASGLGFAFLRRRADGSDRDESERL